MTTTVTLSSKYQLVIPREAMSLSAGDELLVCKPDRVVIIPKPRIS